MICTNCSTPNAADAKFCVNCGARMGCPNCGAPIVPGAHFCGNCGTRLAPADPGGTSAAPGGRPVEAPGFVGGAGAGAAGPGTAANAGPAAAAATALGHTERRVVSVLFADLVGFTTISASRDPETIRELQSRYFERTREIVGRYGGIVEKFIGDAVMAMWGAPTAHEDDAERAVRAAMDLVEMVPVIGRETGIDLQLRAGVLTGEAAVAVGAESEGMVTGDMVNTAARLQSVAAPGTVLVGEATRLAAGGAIAFEAAGEQMLKGKESPVPAWRAQRVVAERGGARRPDAIEPPFVGRADELRFLKEQFHATGRERKARLVSLVGQAGIGKSRIAWELEKYLDGVVEQVWWHRGRAPSYGEGVTFWALSEMFRRRAGLAEGDDTETTRRAVAAMLKQHVPDEAERTWIEPRILQLLGVGEAQQGGSAELFAAWRTFFERLALTGTVALVIEDLQWSDDGLLDFLEHLLDWGRSSPIFVLTLARPELLERRAGWGTDRRGAIAMRLDPLPNDAMRELLAGIAPGLPDRMVTRILERADGIPLYAVETVRMLVARGQLVEQDGQFVPAPDGSTAALNLTNLEVPPTLQALVAARLDALPPADRALLQDAAVIGQSFTLEALAAIHEQPADVLRPRLAALVRREILTLETDPRAPTRGQHAFVQALLREVAFSTLSKKERRARHLAAARYFESLGDDEVAGAVATHFVEAYRAAPEGPEGEAVATQARISLLATAERAHGLGAMRQAIDALGSALEVTSDPAQRAKLMEQLGNLQIDHSDWEAAFATLRAAIAAYTALGDRNGVIRANTFLVRGFLGPSRVAEAGEVIASIHQEGEALVAAALDRGARADPVAGEVGALFAEALARYSFRTQAHDDAILWASRAMALAEPLRLDEVFCMALVTKATTMSRASDRREGIALLEGAIIDATARGIHTAALRGLNNLSSAISDVDPRAALEKVRQGLATGRRLGLRSFQYYQTANGVGSSEPLGEWAWLYQAVDTLLDDDLEPAERAELESTRDAFLSWKGGMNLVAVEAQLQEAIRDNDFQAERGYSAWLSRAAFVAGDYARALELSQRWFRLVEQGSFTFDFGMVARFALHAGRVDQAKRVLELIGDGVGGKADSTLEAVRAGVAAVEGNRDEAIALYRSAFAGFRNYGVKFELALTILDMATFLGVDDPSVKPLVEEARQTFTDLEARPLVDKLDALEAAAAGGSARGAGHRASVSASRS